MREKRKENAGFWDKWGTTITSGVLIIVVLMVCIHAINKTNATAEQLSVRCNENAQEAIQEIKNPLWVEQVFTTMQRQEQEENAPPK